MNNDIKEFANEIKNGNTYVVIGHIRPDGDAVGSVCGFALALESLGKKVYRVFQDKIYDNLKFVPDSEKILNEFPKNEKIDVVVTCDCSEKKRIGNEIFDDMKQSGAKIFNIDHHSSNDFFGDYNYVLPHASSAAEVACEICDEMGIKFDTKISDCFFAGLSSDSGSFRFSSVDAGSFFLAGKLAEAGADIYSISTNLWSNRERAYVELQKNVLNNLQYFCNGQLAISYVTKREMKKAKATREHINGLVGVIRDIEGVKLAVFFYPDKSDGKEEWKMSIRSKDIEVSTIPIAEVFGGGGHKMASGARVKGKISCKKLIKQIVTEASKYL